MANTNVLKITDDTFDHRVLGSGRPVLVDLWAGWCQPCHMLAPIIDQLADEYAGRVIVRKIDIDANPKTATKLGARSIPTVILFKGGQEVRRFVGLTSKQELVSELDKVA